MSNLSDKFQVTRGWTPGGDAGPDECLPPYINSGTPVTLLPGNIVYLRGDGTVDVATTVNVSSAVPPQLYIVVEGNTVDFSADFVGKVALLRGKINVHTDKLASSQTFAVGDPVSYTSGTLQDAGANDHVIGYVTSNTISTDGCIDVAMSL